MLFDRVAAAAGLTDATVGMQETFWALRRVLEQVARQRPVVVIFDDLQWAESAFLDLLDYLVRSCRDAPILILSLARTDLLDDRSEWAARVPGTTMVHLPPLTDSESSDLIEELLLGEDLAGGLKEQISEVGGGNPLFVVEMCQMLRDDGLLGPASGDEPFRGEAVILNDTPDDPGARSRPPRSPRRRGASGRPRRRRDGESVLVGRRLGARSLRTPPSSRSSPPESRPTRPRSPRIPQRSSAKTHSRSGIS